MAPKRKTGLEMWGAELAQARVSAGLSGKGLAEAVNVAPATVSQWENAKRKPHLEDVERVEAVLGTNGYLKRYLVEWLPREVAHQWLDRWLWIEEQATQLRSFESSVMPGLLQTERYAGAVLRDEHKIASRLERQKILDADNPVTFVAVLDESVLRRKVGDAEIMHEQLMRLAQFAERDNIRIHVLPLSADACAEITGPFVIANFNGGDEVVYLDNALSGEVVEDKDAIARAHRIWELLRSDAMNKQDSLAFILKVAEEWKS